MLAEATVEVRQNNTPTLRTVRSETTQLPDTRRIYILGQDGEMIDTFLIHEKELTRLAHAFVTTG